VTVVLLEKRFTTSADKNVSTFHYKANAHNPENRFF